MENREDIHEAKEKEFVMFFLRIVLLVMVVLFTFSPLQAGEQTQDQWTKYMTQNLPSVFCSPNQYYRECYDISQEDCKEAISDIAEACIDQNIENMPDVFTIKESRHWGPLIEKCIDEEYSRLNSDQRIDSQYCKDLTGN